jgi:UDP-2,3-diacylglucosamine hydrolase
MPTGPVYIASDIHLGAVPDETERRFVDFLDHVAGDASRLIVNGDLFDFWFEWGDVVPGRHFRTLGALARVVEAGVPVFLVGGNHDAWGGRFLREDVGLQLIDGVWPTELAGAPALIAHGDGLGAGDLKYRMLKATIRSRAAIWGFRALHPELGMRLARAVSSTETKGHSETAAQGRARFLREWGAERLREDPALRYVVCGHAHVPETIEVEPGRWYLNAGDWIRHSTYLTIDASGAALRVWDRPVPQRARA